MSMFQRATRKQSKLRLAIDGPAGAGKTFTALRIAHVLAAAEGGRVAVLNTESGAVQKYVGEAPDGIPWDFDVAQLDSFSPTSYVEAINEAGRMGYAVLVVDSLSHAWDGVGGSLDQVDRNKSDNKFTAWKDVTPQHRRMVEAILRAKPHVIVTLRQKMEYVLEENERGKKVPRKVGMKPIQREGMEYEFDVYADMDVDHVLTVAKTRCSAVDGYAVAKPGRPFAETLLAWVQSGEKVRPEDEMPAPPAAPVPAAAPRPPWAKPPQDEQPAPATPRPTSPAAPTTVGQVPIAMAPTKHVHDPRPAAPTPTPAPAPQPLASPELVSQLVETADALGMEPAHVEGACLRRGRGAKRFEDLTADDAADMLSRMRGALDAKRAAELGLSAENVDQARGPVRETEAAAPATPEDDVPF